MSSLPCPNPTCKHSFTATELKGATSLKCPLCGTVFQFRSTPERGVSPAPKPTPMPLTKPVAAAKPAVPSSLELPGSPPPRPAQPRTPPAPVGDTNFLVETTPPPIPSSNDFVTEGVASTLVQNRFRRSPQKGWKSIILACVFVIIAGVLVLTFILFREQLLGSKDQTHSDAGGSFTGPIRNLKNGEEKVFKVVASKGIWQLDNGLRTGLKAVLALRRSDAGDAWLAVGAKDYGTRKPRDAELVLEGKEHLENFFGETLELAEKTEGAEIAGQTAQSLEFKGQIKQVFWRGECYMFTKNGIGYWFIMAAPTLEDAKQELAELQKNNRGFVLIDERRGWREQPPKMDPFVGEKFKIRMQAPEGVWEKFKAEDQDERGELFLFGRYLKERDNRKNASVLILALDKKPSLKESLKDARAYFDSKKKEEDKNYQTEPIAEKGEEGISSMIGERPGRILDLRLQLGNEPKRYVLLAVADGGEQHFAILCDCTWESRQIWRQDFLDLMRTFQLKKK